MPTLSRAEVAHIAQLARLELSEEEEALYAEQLGKVLDHFASMASVDTTDVPPTTLPPHLAQTGSAGLRSDAVLPSLERDDALRQAPEAADGGFRVPQISDDPS